MWSVIRSFIPDWAILLQAVVLLSIPLLFLTATKRLQPYLNTGRSGSIAKSSKQANDHQDKGNSWGELPLTGKYDMDLNTVRATFAQSSDVRIREFVIRGTTIRAALLYVDGLFNSDLIDTHLITPLMKDGLASLKSEQFEHWASPEIKKYIVTHLLPVTEISEAASLPDLARAVLGGQNGLMIDGMKGAILVGSAKGKSRNTEEPLSEILLRGPRSGFTEKIGDNTGLLRMQGQNDALFLQKFQIGNVVKKDLIIAHMKGIADPGLVAEVEARVRSIEIDDPLESGYIEQLIEDNILSPFQQLQNTERPDRVISALLEGRVAILLDGTPVALILPATFSMLLQSPEDYYERWIPGSFVRLLRFFAAFLAFLAPALYISFISFHPGLIPTKLAITIIETRKGVPFPSIIEALIMEVSIEILREAGIRLPRPIGPAMGIVGGLIIGEAAVQAGIVSQFLVIVVAITAISSFAIPVYSAGLTLRIFRFAAMFSAAIFGLFGVVMFFLLICSHLVRLKSFGVPYVTPMVPYRPSDWKDLFIRVPFKWMKKRPLMLNPKDRVRR
ncbi:spore germination protein [Paenibacillus terreus]|uniref:Spore germination protein n=1 Tax=Paenibacillus terreus TaxID=1387834 RepID=A0ABV5BEL2_9BACL